MIEANANWLSQLLEILIPTLTLIIVLIVLARRFVFTGQQEDAPTTYVSNTKDLILTKHSSFQKTELIEWWEIDPVHKWARIAWMNTVTMKIQRAYWKADAAVRDMLWAKGWHFDTK
jgi:hypothetical protein